MMNINLIAQPRLPELKIRLFPSREELPLAAALITFVAVAVATVLTFVRISH